RRSLGTKALENHLVGPLLCPFALLSRAYRPGQHRRTEPTHEPRPRCREIVHPVSDEIGARVRRVQKMGHAGALPRGQSRPLRMREMTLRYDAACKRRG